MSSLYELSVRCTECGHIGVVNIQPSDSTPLDIAHAVHAAMDLNCDTKVVGYSIICQNIFV